MISGITDSVKIINPNANTMSDAVGNAMGKEQFLELLVAEMKYQDPLDPKQDKEFIAELAQFSSLEQTQNMNKNMEQFIANQNVSNSFGFINFIGKTVEYQYPGKDPNTGEDMMNIAQGRISVINVEKDVPAFFIDGVEVDMGAITKIID